MGKFDKKNYKLPIRAKILTDIEIWSGDKLFFTYKKGDYIKFKEVVYDKDGKGFLVIDGEFRLPLINFELINIGIKL